MAQKHKSIKEKGFFMAYITNDFVLEIATVNGSGSQSANSIIMKSIFRMGIPVGGRNLFPSNIAGLPTWFTIRVNQNNYLARRDNADIYIALNPQTVNEDLKKVAKGGWIFLSDEFKLDASLIPSDIHAVTVPFKELVNQATDSIKLKKLLMNMIYVGLIAELMGLDEEVLNTTIKDQFKGKVSATESNIKAARIGANYAKENLKNHCSERGIPVTQHCENPSSECHPKKFPYQLKQMNANDGKILIDGNTAAAIGFLVGGCTFVSWYPITPSTSLIESYIQYSDQYRLDENKKMKGAVVQAEDELAAICMVAGAGWAGARAMTSTSGPGLSLMAEAAGYFYYAEVPGVIWDVQRVGPSTGMPTRTAQGDLLFAHSLSHGDTKHILLLPGTMEECFEFAQTSFDLAERFQTLVIVLSDLDLGMNFSMGDEFKFPKQGFDRGKVLSAEDLNKVKEFDRYKDVDGDGIPYRTLPGTKHDLGVYFTRGSGHNENAQYTESSPAYKKVLDRLVKKYETAKLYVPKPIIDERAKSVAGVIAYGSTNFPMSEALDTLVANGKPLAYLRLRALPFTDEVTEFIKKHQQIYVIDQNRDGQMLNLLCMHYPEQAGKFVSIRHYDGMPITAKNIVNPILGAEL
jgi:2-oxoglutarate ferredoxin oxidoreductase subunit alpha